MSKHATALVPAEAWAYNSPDVQVTGKSVDMGLIAEALLYYESIAVSVGNHLQFIEFVEWFVAQGKYKDLLHLLTSGTIKFYDYSFMTSAILGEEGYSIWNLEDPVQAKPKTFSQRYLYRPELHKVIRHARQRSALFRAMEGRVIEVKSSEFTAAIDNARSDVSDARRHAIVLQAFVDELYHIRKLGRPPVVEAVVRPSADGSKQHISWNVRLDKLAEIAGEEIGFHYGTPLIALAHCNRQLWSAAQEGWDLYLSRPMSTLAGDKLYESVDRPHKLGAVIYQLKEAVEFPDIRKLVNRGTIGLDEILAIRRKSQKFRTWLQSESDRERDAIIAYHHEVAKEVGLARWGRKTLNLFGIGLGGALGSVVGNVVAGPVGGALGGFAGSGATFLVDIAAKLGGDWKPVVFGNWFHDRIEKLSKDKK